MYTNQKGTHLKTKVWETLKGSRISNTCYDHINSVGSDQIENRLTRAFNVCESGKHFLNQDRDENSQPFSIRKICRLTPKWRKAIFKSLIKGLKSQNINRNQSVYA